MSEQELQCPVCGYYCLGKGGAGCIDKPAMLRKREELNAKLFAMAESQSLAASKAREDELRRRRATLEANAQIEIDRLNAQILDRDEKLEAAEARIKASREQEPVAYVTDWEGSRSLSFCNHQIGAITKPLYAAPVIQQGIAELQRLVEFWKNSSEEWKLAYVALGGTASKSGSEELTRLLEEAKSKAVPEVTDEMALAFHRALTDGSIGAGEVEEIKVGLRAAMLAAAPQPPKEA